MKALKFNWLKLPKMASNSARNEIQTSTSPADANRDLEQGDIELEDHRHDPKTPSTSNDLSESNNSTPAVLPEGENEAKGPSCKSSSSTLIEKKECIIWPPARYPFEWMRKLRWKYLSVYRRLNVLLIMGNMAAIIFFAVRGRLMLLKVQDVSVAVATNLTLAVLLRNELVANLLFLIFGCCPQWVPLRIRCLFAKIYHLGGVHSGAGMSAVLWFVVQNIVTIRGVINNAFGRHGTAILAITIALDGLLLTLTGLSMPQMRSKFHNTWECSHRFAGWTAIALFWAHFAIFLDAQRQIGHLQKGVPELLVKNPVFWLLLVVTFCIILPWLRLRKVDVHAEPLSKHAIRLHFTYCNLPLCAAPRLSDAPLKEWHSFAGIPEESGRGFSVLVSRAGDWTGKLIDKPPTKLWVRSIPVRGVLHVAPIFKKIILAATGSGIGPVLSLLYSRKVDCRIVWATRHPIDTYKQGIVDDVLRADPNAVILNASSKGKGRVDLSEETYKLYKESGAEVVFIISNPETSYKTVYDLESHGIPAFAPVFDS